MWNVPNRQCMNVFSGHSKMVNVARFTHDGKLIVSVSDDSSVIVWDPKTALALSKIVLNKDDEAAGLSLDIHSDNQTILVGCSDGFARLVNISNGRVKHTIFNISL